MSAAANFRSLPTSTAWLTNFDDLSICSIGDGNVLAAGGLEKLFLAVGDPQKTVLVYLADVARPEPSVVGKRLAGRLLLL